MIKRWVEGPIPCGVAQRVFRGNYVTSDEADVHHSSMTKSRKPIGRGVGGRSVLAGLAPRRGGKKRSLIAPSCNSRGGVDIEEKRHVGVIENTLINSHKLGQMKGAHVVRRVNKPPVHRITDKFRGSDGPATFQR